MRPLGFPPHTPPQPPAAWGAPPGYLSGGPHARGGRGGAGYYGGPRGGQQGPRGGRRGGGPHRYNRQFDSLCNLPIPSGALCDPWAPLAAQRGGPFPLGAPTDEVLEELKAEVARQLQLQRLTRQGEEAPAHKGGPSSSGEGTSLSAEGCSELQHGGPLGGPSEEDEEAADSEAEKSPSPAGGPPLERDCHTGGDGGPSAMGSTTSRGRPLVLPPPAFDTEAPEDASWEGAASSSNDNNSSSNNSSSNNNSSNTSSSSGSAAASVRDGSSLSLPVADQSKRGSRGFLLPAVSGGGPPEGAPGSTWLTLDEESIRKKVRGAPSND